MARPSPSRATCLHQTVAGDHLDAAVTGKCFGLFKVRLASPLCCSY